MTIHQTICRKAAWPYINDIDWQARILRAYTSVFSLPALSEVTWRLSDVHWHGKAPSTSGSYWESIVRKSLVKIFGGILCGSARFFGYKDAEEVWRTLMKEVIDNIGCWGKIESAKFNLSHGDTRQVPLHFPTDPFAGTAQSRSAGPIKFSRGSPKSWWSADIFTIGSRHHVNLCEYLFNRNGIGYRCRWKHFS